MSSSCLASIWDWNPSVLPKCQIARYNLTLETFANVFQFWFFFFESGIESLETLISRVEICLKVLQPSLVFRLGKKILWRVRRVLQRIPAAMPCSISYVLIANVYPFHAIRSRPFQTFLALWRQFLSLMKLPWIMLIKWLSNGYLELFLVFLEFLFKRFNLRHDASAFFLVCFCLLIQFGLCLSYIYICDERTDWDCNATSSSVYSAMRNWYSALRFTASEFSRVMYSIVSSFLD